MLVYLLEKEWKQLLRNPFLPKLFLVLPLMLMLVFPYAANQEVKHLNVVVVDLDGTALARRLTEKVGASPFFDLVAVERSQAAAMRLIDAGEADVVLTLPLDFDRGLALRERPTLDVATNAVNGIKGGIGQAYLGQILADFARELRQEGALPLPVATYSSVVPTVRERFLFNPSLDYRSFMVPAIIAMLLVLVVGFLPTFNIVGEKERGTMEQINVTPIRPAVFILSKLIPYWCVALFLLAYAMLAGWLFHGVAPVGSIALILLFAIAFALIISSLALLVSTYSPTTQAAALLMFFFLIIFLLMSGLLTPVASMPDWAQHIAAANPFRYFIEAMRAIYLKGSGFADLRAHFYTLLAMAAGTMAWAVVAYRKR